MCVQNLGQLTVVVLHTVAFVYDHVLPTNLKSRESLTDPNQPETGRAHEEDLLPSLSSWHKLAGFQAFELPHGEKLVWSTTPTFQHSQEAYMTTWVQSSMTAIEGSGRLGIQAVSAPRRKHWDAAQGGAVRLATVKYFEGTLGIWGAGADKQQHRATNKQWNLVVCMCREGWVILCLPGCVCAFPSACVFLYIPTHLGQYLFVLDDVLISSEQNIKLPTAQLGNEGSSGSRRPLKDIVCSQNVTSWRKIDERRRLTIPRSTTYFQGVTFCCFNSAFYDKSTNIMHAILETHSKFSHLVCQM